MFLGTSRGAMREEKGISRVARGVSMGPGRGKRPIAPFLFRAKHEEKIPLCPERKGEEKN